MLYVAGAGGSLRAGVTEDLVCADAIDQVAGVLVNVTCGGTPVYVWPGGGITVMVDVAKMPAMSFGSVPTPAIVSPIEFTMRTDDYRALGGGLHGPRPEPSTRCSPAACCRRRRRRRGGRAMAACAVRGKAMSRAMRGGAAQRRLDAGRWHFQHGPIDCIVAADGEPGAVDRCVERAWSRFATVLAELVGELPLLRADLSRPEAATLAPCGAVARRMVAACRAHAGDGRFITAMAAVAGSVAEELIAAFADERIARASINNGGDIALHLRPGTTYEVGLCADPERGRFASSDRSCRFTVDAASSVRGIATSGWRGRSFSLGIADSVTVLATTASAADAAATIVANAVDVADARIGRTPARLLKDDSDLGDRLVTRHVPPLPEALVAMALERGAAEARAQIGAGRIIAAVLSLQRRWRVVGEVRPMLLAASAPEPMQRLPQPATAFAETIAAGRPAMLFPATAELPAVDVRKLVCSVEDVWHDNGPRLGAPLQRGSVAAT